MNNYEEQVLPDRFGGLVFMYVLLDNNGTVVVKYKYDGWGNCKVLNASGNEITNANNIGNLNPFRYRSYYYDTETSLYYLQSRYYDPEIGRFITIDDISYLDPDSINGLNLYAYCKNNPVIYADQYGNFAITTFLICVSIGTLVGAGLGAFSAAQQDQNIWRGALTGALLGAIIGAAFGLILAGSAGGVAVHIGKEFIKGGTKAVFGKLTADLTAYVIFDKEIGSITSYMGAFVFGGITGALNLSKSEKIIGDVLIRPAYNIIVDDIMVQGNDWSTEKYVTNAIIRFLTAWLPDGIKPITRGFINGVNDRLKKGGNLIPSRKFAMNDMILVG